MLKSLFLSRLVAGARGRAFLLSFMADAEESDEGAFDVLLAHAEHADVQKMVRTHAEDEARHGRLMRACVERVERQAGLAADELPVALRFIDRLDRLTAGAFRKGFPAEDGAFAIMKVYALLQIVEERGVAQFALIADALRPHDPESAATIDGIVRDEERHVLYARAITRRYAPDEATLAATMAEMRLLEERAFDEHGRDFLAWCVEHDLVGTGRLERAAWRAFSRTIALASRAAPAYGRRRRWSWPKPQDIRTASAPR
jgi:rubrerythrin